MFDLVFLVAEKDIETFKLYLYRYNLNNIIGYNKIYIISPCNIEINNTILINDNAFPFNDLIKEKYGDVIEPSRINWYKQQFIKLYIFDIIPELLDNVLVVDADTFFLKKTTFIDDNGKLLYNYGCEFNKAYFDTLDNLKINTYRYDNYSGITHHMMFNRHIIKEIFKKIEDLHKKPLWIAVLDNINKEDFNAGFSEYETYFNYCLLYHNDKIKLRKLKFNENANNDVKTLDYISNHKWDEVLHKYYINLINNNII